MSVPFHVCVIVVEFALFCYISVCIVLLCVMYVLSSLYFDLLYSVYRVFDMCRFMLFFCVWSCCVISVYLTLAIAYVDVSSI